MRLPHSEHFDRPWRIHAIAGGFRLEDVWALPTPGEADEFPRLVEMMSSFDPARSGGAVRFLFALRSRLGDMLGWDRAASGLGSRVPSLRDRLPADVRPAAPAAHGSLPFEPVYELEDEWAAEIANATVHGVIHLGWVPDPATGGWRGQLAVLVKPNGLLGAAYMAAITPFRHLIVYPQMMRAAEREWRAGTTARSRPNAGR